MIKILIIGRLATERLSSLQQHSKTQAADADESIKVSLQHAQL